MGLFKRFSSCSSDSGCRRGQPCITTDTQATPALGNPNPSNFKIIKCLEVGKFAVVMVMYPDCDNYEGKKILVYRDVSMSTIKSQKSIDPHFCKSKLHISPVARFVPTRKGWMYAVKFCKNA